MMPGAALAKGGGMRKRMVLWGWMIVAAALACGCGGTMSMPGNGDNGGGGNGGSGGAGGNGGGDGTGGGGSGGIGGGGSGGVGGGGGGSGGGVAGLIFSAYKDTSINMNWNTN